MRVYTLTLNPAYDVHATAETFRACSENLATVTSREAGGKGVNISRALATGNTDNTAIIVLGKDNGEEFKKGVKEAGISAVYLEKPGRIRENLTLHSPSAPETRISFAGFSVGAEILREVMDTMIVDQNTVVTFTGRVPAGIAKADVLAFLQGLKNRGAKLVLDSKSLTPEDILAIGPWLIKPNQDEISEYLGCTIETVAQAAEQATVFADKVENVMVSMGEQGALLLTGGNVYTAVPPQIAAVSTIGAGDSTIAGFIAGTALGETPSRCLKRAVAYGTAACLTEGTLPPRLDDIVKIWEEMQ